MIASGSDNDVESSTQLSVWCSFQGVLADLEFNQHNSINFGWASMKRGGSDNLMHADQYRAPTNNLSAFRVKTLSLCCQKVLRCCVRDCISAFYKFAQSRMYMWSNARGRRNRGASKYKETPPMGASYVQ